ETQPIPADLQAKAAEYRTKLVEHAAEATDELMEKYLEEGDLTNEEIQEGVRYLAVHNQAYPVVSGAACRNCGVRPLLHAIVDYLPSPIDVPPMRGHKPGDESEEMVREADENGPFSALAFKIAAHPFFGTLTFIRVYSGKAVPGTQVLNSTKGKRERIGKLFQMHANKE